jgi:hypothetical protein
MPEDKVEEKFEKLIDYLKWSAKIVRKIFTPDAFNYPFWCSTYLGDKRTFLQFNDFSDIQKGTLVFQDGIYPIVEIGHFIFYGDYIRTEGKEKLKEKVNLYVLQDTENFKRILISDDGTDKSFIKNWEKIFREKMSLRSSNSIFFLISKNGTLEIRDFSLNNDYDRVKFGIEVISQDEEKISKRYVLSILFFDLIIEFLKNNYDDRDEILNRIKKLADGLWTDEMFEARRHFLYLNSINLQDKTTLLKAFQKKKALLDKIRTNLNKRAKYLSSPFNVMHRFNFNDLLCAEYKVPSGVYLITEYHNYSVFGIMPINGLIIKDKDNDEYLIYGMPPALVEYYQERSGVSNGERKWRIGLVFSWPTSYPYQKHINYITLWYIDVPFNPYVEQEGILYIPDEISELLVENILKLEPPVQRWIEKRAKEDKEELYKGLKDLLNELKIGNLRDETIKNFDKIGEEDGNKKMDIESWSGDNAFSFWLELIKDIQEQEKKDKEEKVKETKDIKEQDIMEELESVDMEAKVKSKVQVKLPEDMLEELIVEEAKKKKSPKFKSRRRRKK